VNSQKTSYQKGQVAVEYILLVAVSVSIAVLITSLAVSRNKDNPGILTAKWRQIIELIAGDRTAN
jgi:hypothetical protein